MYYCRNKTSGHYFICLEDWDATQDEALFVTPKGDIKLLNIRLFDKPTHENVDILLSKNLINKTQFEKYQQYEKLQEEDLLEENMKNQIVSFIEEIRSNQNINAFDEVSTKQAVVMKLLFLLGWDTFNVNEVAPEYSVKSMRVDFSLRVNDNNKAFIEVKRPLEDLDNHQEQLLNYSFQEGIKLSILTNGITWWFYLPLNEGSWEQRRFYSIDLIQQEPEDTATKFIEFLQKDNIVSGHSIRAAESIYKSQKKKNIIKATLPKAWNKIISEPNELIADLLSEVAEKLCGHRPEDNMIEIFIAKNRDSWLISETPQPRGIAKARRIKVVHSKNGRVRDAATKRRYKTRLKENYTGKSIASFAFKNRKYEVRYWIDLLITLSNVLVDEQNARFEEVLKLVGQKRPYFTRDYSLLRGYRKIDKTNIFVETNLSSNQIAKISYDMIALFGYSTIDLQIDTY